MANFQYDVIVVGAGAAGASAAIGLANAGMAVLVLEAAVFPGAENWSGCVYFAEALAHPDLLGPDGLKDLAWERELVRRGVFATDGRTLLGVSDHDRDGFTDCYTVLRPVFDRSLMVEAQRRGAALLCRTTVEALIRDRGRVIGVSTGRGPFYAPLVFLAEGDAAHLVAKEGYQSPAEGAVRFLQGVKEVIPRPATEIERAFDLAPGEGAAYEVLLKNELAGHDGAARLNMGAFLYTNADSVSLGVVLPLENLASEFAGRHNDLMEYVKGLPFLREWTGGAPSVAYGAKLIQAGGPRQVVGWVDDGLAIGGAAAGLGIDFPVPNYTGPACASGLAIAQAARAIRAAGGSFSRAELEKHYAAPLRATHYAKDAEYLRRWPSYVESTRFFFGPYLDLAAGAARIWSRPDTSDAAKRQETARLLGQVSPAGGGPEALRADFAALRQALPVSLRGAAARPARGEGTLRFHLAGEGAAGAQAPAFLARLLQRARPALAQAAAALYRNDATPLEEKLNAAARLARSGFGWGGMLSLGQQAAQLWLAARGEGPVSEAAAAPVTPAVGQPIEQKLSAIEYLPADRSHIRFFWPGRLDTTDELARSPLWHVCPALVYERAGDGSPRPVVHAENCIKCESCWRASDEVDWGRTTSHTLAYDPPTSAKLRLWRQVEAAGALRPKPPLSTGNWWESVLTPTPTLRAGVGVRTRIPLHRLRAALHGAAGDIAAPPEVFGESHARWLQARVQEANAAAEAMEPLLQGAPGEADRLWRETREQLRSMAAYAREGRFFWAEATARLVLAHHLPGLEAQLGAAPETEASQEIGPALGDRRREWRRRLEGLFDRRALLALDAGEPLSAEARDTLRELATEAAGAPLAERGELLRELARVDAGLADAAWAIVRAADVLQEARTPEARFLLAEVVAGRRFPAHAATPERVPLALADAVLLQEAGGLRVVDLSSPGGAVEPLRTLGLCSGKPARVAAEVAPPVEPLPAAWAADFCSLALGLGERLRERGMEQIESRVQFPGLFQDEEGHDGIAKFGSMKELVGEIEAQRAVLEEAREEMVAQAAGEPSTLPAGWRERLPEMVKAVASRALGTDCGTIAYNVYQFFGGMAYTAQDLIGKYNRDAGEFCFLLASDTDLDARAAAALDPAALRSAADEPWLAEATASPLLGEAAGEYRERLRGWCERLRSGTAAGEEARRAGRFWACRALLRRAWSRIVSGERAETECDLARTGLGWLRTDLLTEAGSRSDAEALGRALLEATGEEREPSPEPFVLAAPEAEGPGDSYEQFLENGATYDFGEFLARPFDPVSPGYCPEMVLADARLRERYQSLFGTFFPRYGRALWDGVPYPQRTDELHRLPEGDREFLREQGYFKVTVPEEFGGSQWSKAEYYLLTYFSARFADMAQALTIQVNNTLGTVPLLTGLYGDLPRARRDLEGFLAAAPPETPAAREKLSGEVRRSPALRLVGRKLAEALRKGPAPEVLAGARGRAEALLAELARREETNRRALRLVAAGWHPVFGLTEPGAGSDTARIATGGTLHRAEVRRDADGTPYFLLGGDAGQRRNLVDAGRLAVEGDRLIYRAADDEPPVPLCYDEYDYETDDPERTPYYVRSGRRVDFTDIAQIRRGEGGEYYEYYELSGSKMWITNTRFAHLACLYVRTPEGLTCVIADRHAEGFVVNRNEPKVGQRGSVTNPISLDRVRVPRENILGLEGRGQVNALETLNLGRTGLATLAGTMIEDTVDQARTALRAREADAASARRLGGAAAEAFAAESLTYAVVGLADHPGTRSVRMESAISKYYATEALQEVVSAAEAIVGPVAHRVPHGLERMKRDARIMTIYEGTNQVQRFAILRELVDDLRERWPEPASGGEGPAGAIQEGKRELRRRVAAAAERWGGAIWQNPNLQSVFFPLAEVAARLLVMESVARRAAWVAEHGEYLGEAYRERVRLAARIALARGTAAVRERLDAYDRRLALLERDAYPAPVRAARAALREWEAGKASSPAPRHDISAPVHIAVLAAPVPHPPPHPTLEEGRLREPFWEFDPAGARALAEAMGARRGAPEQVRVDLYAAAPPAAEERLRRALAAGLAGVTRLEAPPGPAESVELAKAIVEMLGDEAPDLVLCGDRGTAGGRGELPALFAALLGRPLVEGVQEWYLRARPARLRVRFRRSGGEGELAGPCVLAFAPGSAEVEFDAEGFLAAAAREIPVAPASVPALPATYSRRMLPPPEGGEAPDLTLRGVAHLLREALGLGANGSQRYGGPVGSLSAGATLPARDVVAYVAAASPAGLDRSAVEQAEIAAAVARQAGRPLHLVLLAPCSPGEALGRELAGPLAGLGAQQVTVAGSSALVGASPRGVLEALQRIWPERLPDWLLAGEWASEALVRAAAARHGGRILTGVVDVRLEDRELTAATEAYGGRLRLARRWTDDGGVWALRDGAGLSGPGAANGDGSRGGEPIVAVLPLDLAYRAESDPLAAGGARESPWTDADCLVDIGYALKNRDNFERLVVPLELELRRLGVRRVAVGGTRKVTEELKLLPADRQIGQTGVRVQPAVLLALGVSGAPQHLDYIGDRTTIFAFNRDPDAPIMTLNQRRALPKVVPVTGDLFETLPAVLNALGEG